MSGTPTITALVTFNHTDGSRPLAGLVFDAAGDLYGTTVDGGAASGAEGEIFVIANNGGTYATTPTVLAAFNGSDGSNPRGDLLIDGQGDLFGTTANGGSEPDGTVFELVHQPFGYQSTPTVLASIVTSTLIQPLAGLVMDASGDLIGTALAGGTADDGGIFAVVKALGGFIAMPTPLATFGGSNGSRPEGNLIADAAGDLFGTTETGGAGVGGIFELSKSGAGYASAPTLLASFSIATGDNPAAGLVADSAGNLFGTTSDGAAGGFGGVFELAKTPTGYASTPTLLASFSAATGENPQGSLIIDAAGDLFGTVVNGGSLGAGGVFELAKMAGGYASTPIFTGLNGTNGASPAGDLLADAKGDLFGTAYTGGDAGGDGTVFEVTNSGFVVACFAQGTRIATPSGEVAVEHLAAGDMALTASGGARPVVWIGRRRIDCRHHPRPERVSPIRIAAGAFGPAMPSRDLFLSPDHQVLRDGVLVAAGRLVDGARVRQEPCDAVTYFHVELDAHDVLLADGLPCESYRDTGNRASFANAALPAAPLDRAA